MGHDDRREIFERLEALERLVRSRSGGDEGRGEHRGGGRDRAHGRHDRHDRRDHDRSDRRDRDDRDDRHHRDDHHDHRDPHGRHDRDDHHHRGRHGHSRGDRDDRHRGDRDDRYRGGGDGDFQEKRIIDTIVQLVGERLERFIEDQQAKTQRRGDDGREGRIVDHAVRLVAENVREIVQRVVANELDRRVGPPRDRRPDDRPARGERDPE